MLRIAPTMAVADGRIIAAMSTQGRSPASPARPMAESTPQMQGRDPYERHRASSPLETLFDLTFAIAISQVAAQLARLLSAGQISAGLVGFGFAMFSVCWAWVNFSWFASAFDTDDWLFRLVTMVQMAGVLLLALGLPRMFRSIEQGGHLDNSIMVLGYVVMRLAMVFQWLRVARQAPKHRRAALTYVTTIVVAQAGWILLTFEHLSISAFFSLGAVVALVEFGGPVFAERMGTGTPWHARHMAERYGLLAIIALGEGIIGTVASISAIVERWGWNVDALLICVAGTGLTFGLWWVYFMVPSAQALNENRARAFAWGYGHILIFSAIAATGAGLQVTATFIEGKSTLGATAAILTIVVPVGAYLGLIYAMYAYLVRSFATVKVVLLVATAAGIGLPVVLASRGISMTTCLLVLTLAPMVTVVGNELIGRRGSVEARP
jgi:low temperature requirement protein LtrA